MAVFQQVILDKINGTPAHATITRNNANKGLLVLITSGQSGRNTEALGSPNIVRSSGGEDIDGVLGDYHHSKLCSVLRKGRIVVAARDVFQESNIGHGIQPDDDGKAYVLDNDTKWGEILDGGVHNDIGNFYYVDMNLPNE